MRRLPASLRTEPNPDKNPLLVKKAGQPDHQAQADERHANAAGAFAHADIEKLLHVAARQPRGKRLKIDDLGR